MNIICGIDVSSEWIDASLDGRSSKRFARSSDGFTRLVRYAKDATLFVMEATGRYHESLADFLSERGLSVAVVNPARAAHYSRALGSTSKTDMADARMLALYAQRNPVPTYIPKTAEHRELVALVRARASLIEERTKLKNQLQAPEMHACVTPMQRERLELCNHQVKELESLIRGCIQANPEFKEKAEALRTIPGYGNVTVWTVLAEVQFDCLKSPKSLAAFAGTQPKEFTSGKSVRKETRMSKQGNANLRNALYMAALTAIRFEPFKSLYIRLIDRGKAKKSALGAVMNKLARISFAVATRNCAFIPEGA